MDKDFEELERLKKLLTQAGADVEEVEDADFDTDENADETFEEATAFLDEMVGMEHVKEKLTRLARYVEWKKQLQGRGLDVSLLPEPNLTFMFLGDPGTGKTTVAYRMGRILHSLGLLKTRRTMEFRRENLVGENYGSEEMNTKDALEQSEGSVFFLDETYQCFKQATDKRDPGYHILETLMAQFGKPGRCIIMAGYKQEMEEIFKVNQGFRSRIPDDNIIEFTAVSEKMLYDVAMRNFRKVGLQVTPGARQLLRETVHNMFLKKDRDFGNARVMNQLTETIIINHANRIVKHHSEKDATKITSTDIRLSVSSLGRNKVPTPRRIGFL